MAIALMRIIEKVFQTLKGLYLLIILNYLLNIVALAIVILGEYNVLDQSHVKISRFIGPSIYYDL